MPITSGYVRELFANLETGKSDVFFTHVSDNVDWTVMGTHPLAGNYRNKKDFIRSTFERLNIVSQRQDPTQNHGSAPVWRNRGGGVGSAF